MNVSAPMDVAVRGGVVTRSGSDADTPIVRVRNLTKYFRRANGSDLTAVDDVSFELRRGEFLVLLGPSGCGKTTLLRMIAGLETPDRGHIEIGKRTVYSSEDRIEVPPERRHLSMIFQSYALWPHMTVAQNVAYPLENQGRRLSRATIRDRVREVLELVHIGDLAQQYPSQMSGGQQQRVALARALVAGNDLVLFDEPLSNVDARVREQLRYELVAMQRQLGFSAIYVTHDQQEAMGLADRIAVMNQGRLAQVDRPRAIYRAPTSRYVANFIGISNEIPGRLSAIDPAGRAVVTTDLGPVHGTLGSADLGVNDDVIVLFRPERCSIGDVGEGVNRFAGVVEAVLFLGPHTEYGIRCGDKRFRVWLPDDTLDEGSSVTVYVRPEDARILRP